VESYREERKIPLSIEFHTKIIEETKNLLFWFKEHKSCYGKWMIVNGEVIENDYHTSNKQRRYSANLLF